MVDPKELVQAGLAQYSWGLLGSQGSLLGIDLGGYGLRAGLVGLHNQSYTSIHREPSSSQPDAILAEVLEMVRELLTTSGITTDKLMRVGVGFGGVVDHQQGHVRLSPRKPGWENISLKDYFEQAFDAVTLVENNANLIALGEATFGAGKGYNQLLYLHLSSGVGGGIVFDGRLYHGSTATAGEIGHVAVYQGAPKSDSLTTLEEIVSLEGILRRAAAAGLVTDNLHDIFSDHPVGQQVVRETIDLLAMHIAQVVALLDPEIIVMGGVVVRIGGSSFVDEVARQIDHYIAPQFARPLRVVASALGAQSIAIGGVALALDSLSD